MRVRFIIKFYCVLILGLISVTNISADSIFSDTTKLIAGITRKIPVEYISTVKATNVIYPSVLQDHREQSWEYIEKFCNEKRDYLIHVYQTGKKYFPKIADILKRYQLPEELKVLIALESGFNGNAISKGGAVGYWQIMASAAKEYGLQITLPKDAVAGKATRKDDRLNLNKSTLFAARYLNDRRINLNADILLMVASYNCGMGKVRRAIKKTAKENPGYWDVKSFLPAQTRNYVMNFIALNVIFENYDKFVNKQLIFSQPLTKDAEGEMPKFDNSIENDPIVID